MDLSRRTVYLVQRVRWELVNEESAARGQPLHFACPDPSAGEPVKAFLDRDAAEEFRRRREEQARGKDNPYASDPNPFCFGGRLGRQTSMPEAVFLDWLQDAGLTPPDPARKSQSNWIGWWARHAPAMTAEQRDKVWHALDKVRFYAVVEMPP